MLNLLLATACGVLGVALAIADATGIIDLPNLMPDPGGSLATSDALAAAAAMFAFGIAAGAGAMWLRAR